MSTRVSSPRGESSVVTGIALATIHLGACAALLPACFSWAGFGVAFVLYYLTGGLGICLGYHRFLTHRSLRLWQPLEYFIVTLGVLAMQGGPIAWVATHRAHHTYSDTVRDPHDSRRGFYWSHMAWLYAPNPARLSHDEERRLTADVVAIAYYRFLEASAPVWQIALGVALLALGGWSWVVWGLFVRLVVTYHATWLVNSAAHLFGYRTYRAPGMDRSTNNWLVAILAWGEGWHNNHHAFPFSARHGLGRFEIDVTWWTIRVLEVLGLARDVRVPKPEMIARLALARVTGMTPVRER